MTPTTPKTLPLLCVLTALAGCGEPSNLEEEPGEATQAVGVVTPTYAMTKLSPSTTTGLTVDARGRQLLFPIPTTARSFASLKELSSFATASLGATNVTVVTGTKGTASLKFNYKVRQYSSSYWRDASRGLDYRVADAALATLGGTTGRITLGGTSFCIDPDGVCSGLPSYLSPYVTPTLLSHVDGCTSGSTLCTQSHSFFNKVDLGFFKYARHGANTRVTRGASGESWRLASCSATGTVAGPAETVSAVRVTVRTGGDDLRGNSHIFMQLGLPTPFEQSLNGGAGWGNGSTNVVTVPLPAGTTAGQIASFGLRFHSGDCVFCTTDNWNLDEIRVELITPGGARAFLRRGGTPFIRFTGERSRWSLDTATTGDSMLCATRNEGVQLAVTGSNLVKFFNEPGTTGSPGWGAAALSPVSSTGVDSVETVSGGFSLGVRVAFDGSFSPGSAPSFTELESDGICSAHSSPTGSARTGNGSHTGADEVGLCP